LQSGAVINKLNIGFNMKQIINNLNFDQVENFLLNRNMVPIYSAYFQVPIENEDGTYSYSQEVAIAR
jgi:hypothetical protein